MKKVDWIIIFTLLVLFGIISAIYPSTTPVEHDIIRNLQNFMSILPGSIPVFLGDFGYYPIIYGASILSLIILILKKKYKTFFVFGILILSVFHISEFLKILFKRPRPPHELWLMNVTSTSYPSGHSFVNICIFSFITYMILKYVKNKPLKITLTSCLILWVLLVGFSRIWVGVHHPTDVLGGYSAGILCAYIFMIIDRKLTSS